jgi:hypothetical protein
MNPYYRQQLYRDIARRLRHERRVMKQLAQAKKRWRDRRDGKMGAASACRIIDPVSGEVVGIIVPALVSASSPPAVRETPDRPPAD